MLDYSKVRNSLTYFYDDQEEREKKFVVDEIKSRQDKLAKKDEEISNLQYERNLILLDVIGTINNDLRNSGWNLFKYFDGDIFWKAWKYCHHKDELEGMLKSGDKDMPQEEFDKYKSSFGYTKDTVQRVFFGELKDKVKFKEIIRSWEIGYDYIFIYKKQEIQVFIPTFLCDEKTYGYMLNGYHVSYSESDCCTSWITHDLDYHKVADRLQEWLRNEEWKKKDEKTSK